VENPGPPGYKHRNFNIRYLNNGFRIEDNTIRLSIPKKQKEHIKERYGIKADFI
jgi:putative transposase